METNNHTSKMTTVAGAFSGSMLHVSIVKDPPNTPVSDLP